MKLTVRPTTLPLKRPFAIARTPGGRRQARRAASQERVVLIELEHDGKVGLGEASPSSRYGEDVDDAERFLRAAEPLLGDDPFDLDAVAARLKEKAEGGYPGARAAVDIALCDLTAKLSGQPLRRMLGLGDRTPPTAYSIGIGSPRQMAREAQEIAPGPPRRPIVKLKLGADGGLRSVKRVHRALPDRELWVDANEAWTLDQARERIPQLAELGVTLVEQPLPAAELEGYRALKPESPLPIFLDENVLTADDVPGVVDICHGVNIKLQKAGGIVEGLRAVHAAKRHGLEVFVGCMVETQVGIAAGAHVATLADRCDLDGCLLLADDPAEGMTLDPEHRWVLGEGPGLGVRLRERE